jgi:ketosteroid isomerase-like protein
MGQSNADIHRHLSDCWNAGNWDEVYAHYDDEVVFEDNLFPDAGVYRGREQALAHMEELRSLGGQWRFETDSLIESGDDVIWIGRTFGQLSEDVPPYEVRTGAVFTYRGGKIVRIRWFATAEEALAAVGLPADAANA